MLAIVVEVTALTADEYGPDFNSAIRAEVTA